MWHAPSKVNRLQCVDRRTDACTMQRRLEWKAKQLVRRQTSRLRLQNSARVGTNVNRCVCVCACVCVRLRRRLRVPANKKKKKTFLSLIYKLREEKRLFPRERDGLPPLHLRVKICTKGLHDQTHRDRDENFFRNDKKISVRMQGLLWCWAAASAHRAVVCTRRRLQAPFYL